MGIIQQTIYTVIILQTTYTAVIQHTTDIAIMKQTMYIGIIWLITSQTLSCKLPCILEELNIR